MLDRIILQNLFFLTKSGNKRRKFVFISFFFLAALLELIYPAPHHTDPPVCPSSALTTSDFHLTDLRVSGGNDLLDEVWDC